MLQLAVRMLLPAGLLLLLPRLATAEWNPHCTTVNTVQTSYPTHYVFVFDRTIANDQMQKYKYIVKGMTCELDHHENIRLVAAVKTYDKYVISPPMSIEEFHSEIQNITGSKTGRFDCPTVDTLPDIKGSPDRITRMMIFVNGDIGKEACNFTKLEEHYPPDLVSLQQIQLGRFYHDNHVRIHQHWRQIDTRKTEITFGFGFADKFSYGDLRMQIALWVKNIKPKLLYISGNDVEEDLGEEPTKDPALLLDDEEEELTYTTILPISLLESTAINTIGTEESTKTTELIGEMTFPTQTLVPMAVNQRERMSDETGKQRDRNGEFIETASTVTSTASDTLSPDSTTTRTTTSTNTAIVSLLFTTESSTGSSPVSQGSTRDISPGSTTEDSFEDNMLPRRRDSITGFAKTEESTEEITTVWKDQSTEWTEESTGETTTVPSSETTIAVQMDLSTDPDSTTIHESTATEEAVGFMVIQQHDPVRADRTSSSKPILKHKRRRVDMETTTTTTTGPVGLWFRENWIWFFVALIVLLMFCLCIAICIAVMKKERGAERKKEKKYQKLGEKLFAAATETKTAREMARSHHSSSSKSLESFNSLMAREGELVLLVPKKPNTESTQNIPSVSVPQPELPPNPLADIMPVPHPEEGAVDPFSPALPSPFEVRTSEIVLTPVKTTSSFAQSRRLQKKPSRTEKVPQASPTEKDIYNM